MVSHPRKLIILGHTGFIGRAIAAHVNSTHPQIEAIGASLETVDLADSRRLDSLVPQLTSDAAVIMLAAIKRQAGESIEVFMRNMEIIVGFSDLIMKHPVGRVVYFSSAAVYGEDIENLAITEETPVNCRTYYGLGKFAAEWHLRRVFERMPGSSLAILRPATIYGPHETHAGYGPTAFLAAAADKRRIELWGDGSELRELIYVEDVARMAVACALADFRGVLNVAAAQSYSFRQAVEIAEKIIGDPLEVGTRPRSKDKVDNQFDNRKLRTLFPDFHFTNLATGMQLTYERQFAKAPMHE